MEKIILENVTLQNFATFDNQTINFKNGFNSIVGETGSGKSLILDAFQFILGSRADKKVVRKGEQFAVIESTFKIQSSEISSYLLENGFPTENQLVIKRIINLEGSSKCFLNNLTCPLGFLQQFTGKFVDLVGQFENQKLMSPDYQIDLIDYFAKNNHLTDEYSELYQSIKDKKVDLEEKENHYQSLKEKEDYLRFQLSEIEKLNPTRERENELLNTKSKLQNFNKFRQNLSQCENIFGGNPHSILSQLSSLERLLGELEGMDEIITRVDAAKNELEDISYEVSKFANEEAQEDQLENVLDELDSYQKMKMKFGGNIESILIKKNEFDSEISLLEELNLEIQGLKEDIHSNYQKLLTLAERLHDIRVNSAKTISKKITKFIQKLNMTGASVEIRFSKLNSPGPKGMSQIKFLAETNPGEGLYPIKDIASGGELSRILLGVRNIVANSETISIFFFDEIDTGIGGDTAKKIGKALQEISQSSQVLAITHLPQIANFSNSIIYVEKETIQKGKEMRTQSFVRELQGKEKDQLIMEMNSIS